MGVSACVCGLGVQCRRVPAATMCSMLKCGVGCRICEAVQSHTSFVAARPRLHTWQQASLLYIGSEAAVELSTE